MLAFTTVTQKGQITLPAKIRKKAGIKAKDRIVVEYSPTGTIQIKKARDFFELEGIVGKSPKGKASVKKMRREFLKYLASRSK